MKFNFDHLVHLVKEPEQALRELLQIGLVGSMGGEHPQWGSFNSLCYFGLSYIEYLGINRPETALNVDDNELIKEAVRELPGNEGLSTIALRTNDIEGAAEYLRKLGRVVKGPFPGRRTRRDGSILEWSMVFVERLASDESLPPFYIDWKQSDREREQELKQRQLIREHALGPVRLQEVLFASQSLDKAVETWSALCNLEPEQPFDDPEIAARCIRLRLPGGNVLFCSPTGPGLTQRRLSAKGPGPFLVRFEGAETKQTKDMLGSEYQFH